MRPSNELKNEVCVAACIEMVPYIEVSRVGAFVWVHAAWYVCRTKWLILCKISKRYVL